MKRGERSPGGWECDTNMDRKLVLTADIIREQCLSLNSNCGMIVLTGGEPALQIDEELVELLGRRHEIAIETNGTLPLPRGIDWVTVSPKDTDLPIVLDSANEVKYVLTRGQALPGVAISASHYWISPAFKGNKIDQQALAWCIECAKQWPRWKLSVQQHKLWGVR
jgi:organic radical activating enzyme